MDLLARLLLLVTLGAQNPLPGGPSFSALRVLDSRLAGLLADGLDRSQTLQDAVASVQGGKVMVFVLAVRWLPHDLSGAVTWMGASPPYRYVRVSIRQAGPDQMLATLGHELRHVMELNHATWVSSERSLLEFYQLIGDATSGSLLSWDTAAARLAGDQILRELKGAATDAVNADER